MRIILRSGKAVDLTYHQLYEAIVCYNNYLAGVKYPSGTIQDEGNSRSGNHNHSGRPGKVGGSMPNASAKGANKLQHRGFRNKQHLNNHWKNEGGHWKEYAGDGIVTAEQYEKRAVELAEMPVGGSIKGYKTREGYICRYDAERNDYVKADLAKGIRTMFKPEDGENYYLLWLAKEGIETDE